MNVLKGLLAAAVVAIWLALGFRLLTPDGRVGAVATPAEQPQAMPELVDYQLELAFANTLFRLPPRKSSVRGPRATAPDPTGASGRATRKRAARPTAPLADVKELAYVGYVQAEDAQPTALLRYGERTSYANVDGGLGAYRVLAITPDSVRVLHTPTATEHSLGIQF